ncbi:MAG: hypothetical protein HDR46_05050 [Bacteroides sp.]|nr:hypothetical protein [Bacteroides sp.]
MNKRLLIGAIFVLGIIQVAFSEDFSFNLLHTLNGRYKLTKYPHEDDEVTTFFPSDWMKATDGSVDIKILNDQFQIIEENHITSPELTTNTLISFHPGWILPNSTRFILAFYAYGTRYSSSLVSFSGETLFTWNEYIDDVYVYTQNGKCFLLAYCFIPSSSKYRTYIYSIENFAANNSPAINNGSSIKKMTFDLNGIPVENPNTSKVVISVMEDGTIVKRINTR